MYKIIFILLLMFFFSNSASADNGNPKVLDILKKNTIVNAAVAQAKKFSGAKTCKYTVESKEVEGFEKGSTFDYSAEIACKKNGFVSVKGRMFSSMGWAQDLELSIRFAG